MGHRETEGSMSGQIDGDCCGLDGGSGRPCGRSLGCDVAVLNNRKECGGKALVGMVALFTSTDTNVIVFSNSFFLPLFSKGYQLGVWL